MRGHESHVMLDGSEHDANACPDDCTLNKSMRELLALLDAGAIQIVRVQ